MTDTRKEEWMDGERAAMLSAPLTALERGALVEFTGPANCRECLLDGPPLCPACACKLRYEATVAALSEQVERLTAEQSERVAQLRAHRACGGAEHDIANGKIHGFCVVCLTPWPCPYAGTPPVKTQAQILADADRAFALATTPRTE